MQYRIKVIEYESGRKEYVPQVRRKWWNSWKYIYDGASGHIYDRMFKCQSTNEADAAIIKYKQVACESIIKSVTYKPVKP